MSSAILQKQEYTMSRGEKMLGKELAFKGTTFGTKGG